MVLGIFMKKILIISEFFAPVNRIAAVRPTKFAKYLSLNGFQVDVLTRKFTNIEKDNLLEGDLKYVNKIIYNQNNKIVFFLYNCFQQVNGKLNSVFRTWTNLKICSFLGLISTELLDYDYYKQAIKSLNFSYDIVLSSYGPLSSHYIALDIKKRFPGIIWIADFRDPLLERLFGPLIFEKYLKMLEIKIERYADIITLVSEGCFSIISQKVHILPNGYDNDDYQNDITNEQIQKLSFLYTGSLYNDKRTGILIFFQIINELINDKIIDKNDIEIQYAGWSSGTFLNWTKKYTLSAITKNFGYIKRKAALTLQRNASLLLVTTWNTQKHYGILTGKFFEYLMEHKPILGFVNGEIKNSALSKIINRTNVGCCYEESAGNYLLMKDYIKDQYVHWKKNKTTFFYPNISEIDKYNFKELTSNLISLFKEYA